MTGRGTAIMLLALLAVVAGVAVASGGADPKTRTVTRPALVDGHAVKWWAARARRNGSRMRARFAETRELHVELRRQRRTLLHDPQVTEALNLAGAVYGHAEELWRKARCETGGTFDPRAYNPSGASGLLQFIPSTWASTPFGAFDPFSPYANALAAGWMHAVGRGHEWSCQ